MEPLQFSIDCQTNKLSGMVLAIKVIMARLMLKKVVDIALNIHEFMLKCIQIK